MQSINQIHKQIINNLKHVQKVFLSGDYMQHKPMLKVLVLETIEMVRDSEFEVVIKYDNTRHTNHVYAHVLQLRKAKAKTIAELEDLNAEFSKKTINIKHVISIISKLLDSDLHVKEVQASANKWVSLHNKATTKTKVIYE